ncbi:MAG: hypothetical protein Q8885_02625, partial [Candidatus Phytoplasma stylosanthis]|nr:hypothetical protein [Candidatus Phytoplasma stylosanthis]
EKHHIENILVKDIGLSDHNAIWASLPRIKDEKKIKEQVHKRYFTSNGISEFKNKIKNLKWKVEPEKSVDDNYNNFLNDFILTMNEVFPPKPRRVKNRKVIQWVTEGIRVSSRNKRRLHKEAMESGSIEA